MTTTNFINTIARNTRTDIATVSELFELYAMDDFATRARGYLTNSEQELYAGLIEDELMEDFIFTNC